MNTKKNSIFVAIFLVFLLFYTTPLSYHSSASSNDVSKKFSFTYFPSFNTGKIGVVNQMEIELNLSASGSGFYAGVPVAVSAAGGIYGDTGNIYVENVTIIFTGANPDESQPANGVVINPIANSGTVLFPSPTCPTGQNGVIFSEPSLCGFNNTIVWPNTGTYHPVVTIYYSNGTKPFVNNDTSASDLVTVVQAPPVVNFSPTLTIQNTQPQPSPNPFLSFGAIIVYAIGAIASVLYVLEYFGFKVLPRRKKRRYVKSTPNQNRKNDGRNSNKEKK